MHTDTHTHEPTTETLDTDLGSIIDALYEQYLELYGDAEIAAVAAAATVNDLITETLMVETPEESAPEVAA